ncbi:ash family protein [Escherichia coli]|uniref:ash family protein n=1 Tax=Escherichia coli TaxID=562 RepID=UPI003F4F38CE
MNSLTANNRLSQQLVVSVAEHLLLRHECRLPNHLAVSNHRELYLTVGGELCRNLTAGFVTEEGFMSMLFVGSQKHSALSIFAKTTRMSALVLCGNSGVILLSVKDHQHIDSAIPGRYTAQAPYKAGAGICTPELSTAIYDAPASFLSSALTHARIMVGWAGEPKGSPVSVDAGSANPVQSATSEICTSGGGSFPQSTEAAIMATVPVSPYLKIEVVNGRAVIFSLYVACHFKRMHKNIVDRIEYLNCSREFLTRNFIPGTYRAYGDLVRGYYITRDGLMMLQLGLSLRTMRYYESCIDALHEVETVQGHSAFRRNQREVRP